MRIRNFEGLCKISFSIDNQLYVFCDDGKYFNAKYNTEKGGECEILFENNIFFKS